MGASVGLADGPITENTLALSYMYQEDGLRADVACIYNTSTKFIIADESETYIYPVVGNLPEQPGLPHARLLREQCYLTDRL